MSRPAEFEAEARAHAKAIWDGINALVALQREWNALDYGGTNAVPSAVGSVVFSTADAMVTLLATGHATNIANLL